MRLQIVGHPLQQMQRRNVTRDDIEHALANCHTSFQGRRSDSTTYIGPGVGGADLKVWAIPPGYGDEDTTIIKSVAWKDEEDPT